MDLHRLAPALGPHGGLKELSRYLRSARGGFCFPLPSCKVRAEPDGEDHRSVTEAGSESGGRKQRGREFRQEEQRGGSQVGSASCLSTPSSAPRPQRPLHVLRGGQVTEQQGWEQGKPCGMPGARGGHRAVIRGQEAEVTAEESASFGKVPYVLRAFKTSSLLFRMGGRYSSFIGKKKN